MLVINEDIHVELLELLELYCELLLARFGLLDQKYVLDLFYVVAFNISAKTLVARSQIQVRKHNRYIVVFSYRGRVLKRYQRRGV